MAAPILPGWFRYADSFIRHAPHMRALGIDVSVRRGLDAVLLDENRQVVDVISRLETAQLLGVAHRLRPDTICIDAPAGWARSGRSRLAERVMAKMGITAYATPADPGDHPFYRWMRAGFAVYAAVAEDYPLYRGGPVVGRAVEVFPHASAVLLAGRLPGMVGKLGFRLSVLRGQSVDTTVLGTQDRVDAALAALTGILALNGVMSPVGDPDDGLLILPVRDLPLRLQVSSAVPGERPATTRRVPSGDMSRSDPGAVAVPRRCGCGCGEVVGRNALFRPGHDGRYRGRLIRAMRQGEAARKELERLGWLPSPRRDP